MREAWRRGSTRFTSSDPGEIQTLLLCSTQLSEWRTSQCSQLSASKLRLNSGYLGHARTNFMFSHSGEESSSGFFSPLIEKMLAKANKQDQKVFLYTAIVQAEKVGCFSPGIRRDHPARSRRQVRPLEADVCRDKPDRRCEESC